MALWEHTDDAGTISLQVNEHEALDGTVSLTVGTQVHYDEPFDGHTVLPFLLSPDKARALGRKLVEFADSVK